MLFDIPTYYITNYENKWRTYVMYDFSNSIKLADIKSNFEFITCNIKIRLLL